MLANKKYSVGTMNFSTTLLLCLFRVRDAPCGFRQSGHLPSSRAPYPSSPPCCRHQKKPWRPGDEILLFGLSEKRGLELGGLGSGDTLQADSTHRESKMLQLREHIGNSDVSHWWPMPDLSIQYHKTNAYVESLLEV